MASRDAIVSQQLAQVRRLLAEILPRNKFYRKKFTGIDLAIASLEDFSRRFPFTTKQELVESQNAFPPFGQNLTFPLEQYTRFHQTSGTTSKPLRWLDTPESWESMVDSWKEVYVEAGVKPGDRVYFAFSFGPFLGFWLAFDAAQKLGCLSIPGGGLGTEARLRAIVDNNATVLCCTPSYALRLAEVAAQEKIALPHTVKTIIVAGEPGGSIPATRERLEKLWPGVRIFDHHGMTETGPVTHECFAQPGVLQVIESAYYAEVVNPDGTPIKPGETGELILTTLNRTASPLLRYRTGDVVKPFYSQRSTSNSQLLLQGGILGRTDDMVIIRGVNVYPSAVEDVLRRFNDIAEYQVAVEIARSMAEMTVRIEIKGEGPDEKTFMKQVQDALHAAFNLRVPITIVPAGTLPRFEMKAKRWNFHVKNKK